MRTLVIVLLAVMLFSGLALATESQQKLVVSSSFSIIFDFVEQVGQDRIDHRLIVPVGAEVHEWELIPGNFVDLEETDLFFYNGLNLEEWLPQADSVLSARSNLVALAEVIEAETLPIRIGERRGDADPHLWMNPRNVIAYVSAIADALSVSDPVNEEFFRQNAANYQAALEELDQELSEMIEVIPAEKRVLITSEAAFLYFADAYGFLHDGIWGSNAEEEGTPQQIVRILQVIEDNEVAAVFWESTISDRYVQTVAADTQLPVRGPLYVDSLGRSGTYSDSYLQLMRHNVSLIAEALGAK